ncbi:hypothetical protein AB4Z21_38570, partial [Paenibacillus sp. MCAF20]
IELPKQGSISNPKQLENKLLALLQIYRSSDPFRAIALSLQTMELFLEVYRGAADKKAPSKSDRTVQRIIDYLEQKEGYSLHSQELSAKLELDYSYLCEVFKTKTRSTIHMYNSRIFIDKAIVMM